MTNKCKAAIVLTGAAILAYVCTRSKEFIHEKEWTPTDMHEEELALTDLMKTRCNLDYPCVFDDVNDITCRLIAKLCEVTGERCDVIIHNNLETCDKTYTMFTSTADHRYITYYNPQSTLLQITTMEKR